MPKRVLLVLSCGLAVLLRGASAAAAPIYISEVLYDASGTDDGKLFVELYGPAGTDLGGLVLEGVNGADGAVGPVLALAGAIPADGFFVVADQQGGTTLVAEADQLLDFDLQNGPDSVVLRDGGGNVLDALGYGVFAPGEVFAGEGSPAADPVAGKSLARLLANVDTGDNAADFGVLDTPTPGVGATQIPEPQSLVLSLAGVCTLGALRTRFLRPPWTAG